MLWSIFDLLGWLIDLLGSAASFLIQGAADVAGSLFRLGMEGISALLKLLFAPFSCGLDLVRNAVHAGPWLLPAILGGALLVLALLAVIGRVWIAVSRRKG